MACIVINVYLKQKALLNNFTFGEGGWGKQNERKLAACVAAGIVGARNKVLTAEPLKASGEPARRTTEEENFHIPRYFSLQLANSGCGAKTLFHAPIISPATQARKFALVLYLV